MSSSKILKPDWKAVFGLFEKTGLEVGEVKLNLKFIMPCDSLAYGTRPIFLLIGFRAPSKVKYFKAESVVSFKVKMLKPNFRQ